MVNWLKQYPLIAFLVLFFVLLAGDRLAARLAQLVVLHSTMPHISLYNGKGQANIIILGNSRAYRHIDEKMLADATGETVKNYAMPAAGGLFLSTILQDYIDHYGAPERVLLEPSALAFDDDQLIAHRWFRHMSTNMDAALHQVDERLWWAGNVLNLIDMNSLAFLNNLHKVFSHYQHSFREGTVEKNVEIPENNDYLKPSEDGRSAFQNIVSLSNQYGFALDIVFTPLHPKFRDIQTEYSASQLKSWIRGKAPGARILSLENSISGTGYFADLTHLNEDGKNILMEELLPYFKADRRS